MVVGEVLGVMGAWLLLSRRFKGLTDRYDSITVPDYLESRFRDESQAIRVVAAVALTVFVTIYVSAQIDAERSEVCPDTPVNSPNPATKRPGGARLGKLTKTFLFCFRKGWLELASST